MTAQTAAESMMHSLVLRPRLPVSKRDKHTPAALESANIGLEVGENMDSNVISGHKAPKMDFTYFQSTRPFILNGTSQSRVVKFGGWEECRTCSDTKVIHRIILHARCHVLSNTHKPLPVGFTQTLDKRDRTTPVLVVDQQNIGYCSLGDMERENAILLLQV